MLPEGVSKSVPAERRADDVAKVESGVKLAGAAGDVARDIGVLVARVSRIETILGLGVSNALKVDTIDAIASTPAPETRLDDEAVTTLAPVPAASTTPATGAHFATETSLLPVTPPDDYRQPFPVIPPDSPAATTVPLNAPGTVVHSTGDASQPATESVQAFLDNPNVPEAIKAAVRAGQGLIGGV